MDPDEQDNFNLQDLLRGQQLILHRALAFNQAISERFDWQKSLLTGQGSPPPSSDRLLASAEDFSSTPPRRTLKPPLDTMPGSLGAANGAEGEVQPRRNLFDGELPDKLSPKSGELAEIRAEAALNEEEPAVLDKQDASEMSDASDKLHSLTEATDAKQKMTRKSNKGTKLSHGKFMSTPLPAHHTSTDRVSASFLYASLPEEDTIEPDLEPDQCFETTGDPMICDDKQPELEKGGGNTLCPRRQRRTMTKNTAEILLAKAQTIEKLKEPLLPLPNHGLPATSTSRWLRRFDSPLSWSLTLDNKKCIISKDLEEDRERLHPKNERMHFLLSVAEMKRRVAENLYEPERLEEDFYADAGLPQAIARAHMFKQMTMAFVLTNIIWISVDVDLNKADVLCKAPIVFQVIDNLYCFFFFFELLVRFLAFRQTMDALQEPRFVFDLVMVILVVWECWIQVLLYLLLGESLLGDTQGSAALRVLRVTRVFRLARVARVAKVVDLLPELRLLAKGFLLAIRSVFTILIFLAIVIYIFGLAFTQLLSGDDVGRGRFETVPQTLNFLLLQVLCGFDIEVFEDVLRASYSCYILLLLFLFITALAIMNMLIGVICSVVQALSDVEEEETFAREAMQKLKNLLISMDVDGNRMIDKREVENLLDNRELLLVLKDQNIDINGLLDFIPFMFRDEDELKIKDFLSTLIQFRGTRSATVKDLVEMRKFMSMEMRYLSGFSAQSETCISDSSPQMPNWKQDEPLSKGAELENRSWDGEDYE